MDKLSRWPLLLAGVLLAGAGIAIDLATAAPIAFGAWALAAVCLGAFVYAEGARHREWLEHERRRDTPRHAAEVDTPPPP